MAQFVLNFNVVIVVTTTVNFTQLMYSTAEHDGFLQPVLILSNVLSTSITLQITDNNSTAIGEYTVPSRHACTVKICLPLQFRIIIFKYHVVFTHKYSTYSYECFP